MKKKINSILKFIDKHSTIFLILLTIILEMITYITMPIIKDVFKIIILILFAITLIFLICFNKSKPLKKRLFYIIYIFGVLIRINYILNTNIYTRQHDVETLDFDGHLKYIYILYKTHQLPPTINMQFYHPPLWHALSENWLNITRFIYNDLNLAFEGIQLLSLFFSSAIVLVTDKICQKLKLKDRYRYLIDLMIAFHPTLIIFSGSINNDCLLTFMESLVILLLINWNEKPTTKNTIIFAIVTGLCVLSKANGAIMAVPILYVFIKKIIKNLKDKKELINCIQKIYYFAIISLPIGLGYQLRNYLKFANISIPHPSQRLYTGDINIFSRFFTLNFNELFTYYPVDTLYNIPAFIIKSSIFGEFPFNSSSLLNMLLIATNLILIVISIIFMIKYLFNKKKNIIIDILIITNIISMIMMYIFNYQYPYGCTMNFRYIVICLLPGIITIGYTLNNLKNKKIKYTIETLCYSFIISCIILSLIW